MARLMKYTVAAVAALVSLGCSVELGEPPRERLVPVTPVKITTPTARPLPTATLIPTATPEALLNRSQVEALVWDRVRPCADLITGSSETDLEVNLSSTYSAGTSVWTIDAASQETGLNFGHWEVSDQTASVEPVDHTAIAIDSGELVCGVPASRLAQQLTPPRFSTPTPTPTPEPTATLEPDPTPTPTPEPTPTSSAPNNDVALLLWERVRTCADRIARTEEKDIQIEFTVVGAKDDNIQRVFASNEELGLSFGTWEVESGSRTVTPGDEVAGTIAIQADSCALPAAFLADGLTPPDFLSSQVVGSQEIARIKVWVTVRDCFFPVPGLEAFTAYQDRPNRWLIEGRSTSTDAQEKTTTVTYGLWIIDAGTGIILPQDAMARSVSSGQSSCFSEP